MKVTSLILFLFSLNLFAATMNDIDERLTDIELKLVQRKIDFNLELQMFGGYLDNDNSAISNQKYHTKIFKNNIRLKMKGELNQDFQAYVSLQMAHTFNDNVQSGIDTDNDTLTPTNGSNNIC